LLWRDVLGFRIVTERDEFSPDSELQKSFPSSMDEKLKTIGLRIAFDRKRNPDGSFGCKEGYQMVDIRKFFPLSLSLIRIDYLPQDF
jgi:hypothetical protein